MEVENSRIVTTRLAAIDGVDGLSVFSRLRHFPTAAPPPTAVLIFKAKKIISVRKQTLQLKISFITRVRS